MLYHYGFAAMDMARERGRDLAHETAHRRLVEDLRGGTTNRRPRGLLALVARPLRGFGNAAQVAADAACHAATRLERQSA